MNVDIEKRIPHRPPFVMVDKLIVTGEECNTTSFYITDDNVLSENGYFSEAGIIENIAQSVAITRGQVQLQEGNPPKIGYIGSIKNLVIHGLPKTNTELITEITITHQVLNFTSVHGKSSQNGTVIAECDITIATQE